jgi:hypothetical protein
MDMIAMCNLAFAKIPSMHAECASVIDDAQAQEGQS